MQQNGDNEKSFQRQATTQRRVKLKLFKATTDNSGEMTNVEALLQVEAGKAPEGSRFSESGTNTWSGSESGRLLGRFC